MDNVTPQGAVKFSRCCKRGARQRTHEDGPEALCHDVKFHVLPFEPTTEKSSIRHVPQKYEMPSCLAMMHVQGAFYFESSFWNSFEGAV
jgi:hypothetical protein